MSSLALSRLSSFNNSTTSYVVLAAANKLKAKPMIPLPADDHHHHDEHIGLPNSFVPSTSSSLGKLLMGGSLRVQNSFTSKATLRI